MVVQLSDARRRRCRGAAGRGERDVTQRRCGGAIAVVQSGGAIAVVQSGGAPRGMVWRRSRTLSSWQTPRFEHWLGHGCTEQSGPVHGDAHSHAPLTQ
jgi:hypothetical protein